MDVRAAYQELDVAPDSAQVVIKAKYRKLVLELHPDRNEGRNEARLKRITMAYHVLKDASKHDDSVREQRTAQNTRNTMREGSSPGPRTPPNAGQRTPEEDWSRFTAEFEEDVSFWKAYESNFWRDYEKRRASEDGPRPEEHAERKEPQGRPDDEGQTAQTRAVPRYNVRIEKSLCIGCCSCETIAPGMFYIDKNTKVNPKSSVTDPLGAGAETLMDAAETCPTKAIIVGDTATGRRVYPL